MFTLPIVIVIVLLVRRANRYSREELAEHLADYPYVTAGSGSANNATSKGGLSPVNS